MSPWRCVTPPIGEPWLIAAPTALDVVTAGGSDAVAYLHGQLAQDIEGLGVGECRHSLLLQPQGKLVAWLRVVRTAPDAVALIGDAGAGADVLARLERFKLRMDCRLELTTHAATAVRASDPATLPPVEEVLGADGSIRAVPLLWPSLAGVDILGAVDLGDEAVVSAGLLAALRVGAGIPAHGREVTEDSIPAELGVVAMSSDFTKGCYVGQELVARMDSRGNLAPRRLRSVCGSGDAPAAETPVHAGEEEIGRLTSVAAVGDGWVGLASIKRAALELTAGSVSSNPVTLADQIDTV